VSKGEERHLSGGTGVGKKLIWAGYPFEIVGVVGDVHDAETTRWAVSLPAMYLINFRPSQINHFVVRTADDPHGLLASIKEAIEGYDGSLHVTQTTAMSDLIADSLREQHFHAFVTVMFGAAALVLAGAGIFALASHSVAIRRQEIAIRVALGASATHVRRLVFREAAFMITIGIAAGAPGAFAALGIVRSLLFGIENMPISVAVSSLVAIVGAGGCAAIAPALRATRIDAAKLLHS
jgi:ABC-type antimicrobial peptide transport system permease subunit